MENAKMRITFPGKKKVHAQYGDFRIETDQPLPSGDGTAPAPFDLFLASIGTCAGIYVVSFCQRRGLPTEGLELVQSMESDPKTGMVSKISLSIHTPPGFPENYRESLINAANLCLVKKHLKTPPAFEITAD